MFSAFLIKYAEIGIKGKNRYLFEDALVNDIKYALRRCDGSFRVHKADGRIYVDAFSEFDYDETVDNLKTVFGVSGICPVVHVEDTGFEQLTRDVISYMDTVYADKHKTFKVFARRARKNYPMQSPQMNEELGAAILEAFPDFRVDVHRPDIQLNVEVREKIYLYSEVKMCIKRQELIIQKAVELGVYEIIPVAAGRCVVKLDAKKEAAKSARWNAIAEAAAKQSRRAIVPKVSHVMQFADAVKAASKADVKMIPYELSSDMERTKDLIGGIRAGMEIAVMIGPEGGFEEAEIAAATAAGIVPVTLGRRILRTETAGFTVMAWLMYHLETA